MMLLNPGEAGCCRQVATSHSDHYRQVLLYMILLGHGRLAAVDRYDSILFMYISEVTCSIQ